MCNVHPHTLRHSDAIHLVRNEMDLQRVQLLMDHSNLNTTQLYIQFKDQDLREIYDKIEFWMMLAINMTIFLE